MKSQSAEASWLLQAALQMAKNLIFHHSKKNNKKQL